MIGCAVASIATASKLLVHLVVSKGWTIAGS